MRKIQSSSFTDHPHSIPNHSKVSGGPKSENLETPISMCQPWAFYRKSFGIVILNKRGKIHHASTNVSDYLKRYFDYSHSGALQDLPPQLLDWLGTGGSAHPSGAFPAVPLPLCLCHAGQRLVVTPHLDGNGSKILLFAEKAHLFSAEELQQIGLTPRESNILFWMAEGKGYDVIGTILNLSKRTVENHVQSIFKKFNVSTSREALLHVFETLAKQDYAPTPVDALADGRNSCVNCPAAGLAKAKTGERHRA